MVCRILRNSATNYRRTVILARRDDANIHLFLYQTGERDVATVENIASEEGFRYQEFIERATTLSSPAPKLAAYHYALFEKIVAQHPEMKEPCCITLCQLFLKKDESLQKKAANFISNMETSLHPISRKHCNLINRRCFKACMRYSLLSNRSLQKNPMSPMQVWEKRYTSAGKTTLFPSPPTKKISCSSLVVCSTWRKVGR